jgi:hypothetical protein
MGLEPTTSSLGSWHSTTELLPLSTPYKHHWLQWLHLSILPIPRYANAASNVFTAALFSSRSDCVYTSRDTPIPWHR